MSTQTQTTAATSGGSYPCFNCGGKVIWGNSYSFSEYGVEGDGVVHELHCLDCGAEIVYYCEEEKDEATGRA